MLRSREPVDIFQLNKRARFNPANPVQALNPVSLIDLDDDSVSVITALYADMVPTQFNNHPTPTPTPTPKKKNLPREGRRRWFLSATTRLLDSQQQRLVPQFFETNVVENRVKDDDDKDLAVPADEGFEAICYLCREAFEEFYSHDAEDWMYRGAVYLNGLGPIVHAKCLS